MQKWLDKILMYSTHNEGGSVVAERFIRTLKSKINKQMTANNKQIFHAFLFNTRNYSPEVINIQRREADLNIILTMVNNSHIKEKRRGIFVLLYATNTKQDLRR